MENNEQQIENKFNGIEQRITRKPADLIIYRVPRNTLDRFRQIANFDDFCSDYGMALKYLIDFHDGILAVGNEHLEIELARQRQEIDDLKQKINELSNQSNNQEKETSKRCGPR